MSKENEVFWFGRTNGEGELYVTRLRPSMVGKYARPILSLMMEAYERQFELKTKMVARGTMKGYFDPDSPNRIDQQAQKMKDYMAGGSSYFVASHSPYLEPADVVGLAKTSPSRPTWKHKLGKYLAPLDAPNCYINDLVVKRPRQGHATALLWAALQDYPDKRLVVADVLPGAEEFFNASGMVPVEPQPAEPEVFTVGVYGIVTVRYGSIAVGAVKQHLLQNKPHLAHAEAYRA